MLCYSAEFAQTAEYEPLKIDLPAALPLMRSSGRTVTEYWYSEPVYNGLPIEGAAPELVGVEQSDGTVWFKPSHSGWQKSSTDALMRAGFTRSTGRR